MLYTGVWVVLSLKSLVYEDVNRHFSGKLIRCLSKTSSNLIVTSYWNRFWQSIHIVWYSIHRTKAKRTRRRRTWCASCASASSASTSVWGRVVTDSPVLLRFWKLWLDNLQSSPRVGEIGLGDRNSNRGSVLSASTCVKILNGGHGKRIDRKNSVVCILSLIQRMDSIVSDGAGVINVFMYKLIIMNVEKQVLNFLNDFLVFL